MKKLILAILLFPLVALAVDLGIIDPTIEGSKTLLLTCKKPLRYTDNTDIAVDEVVNIQWKVSVDGGVEVDAGDKTIECKQIIDLTQVADGDYVYRATAWARGKESELSADFVRATVKRLPNSNPPTGITGTVS